MINVAVMGYGTVGSGVVEVFRVNQDLIDQRVGEEIRVKYVLDLREFPGDPSEHLIVHDFEQIVSDPEIAIVVETMGGLEPAHTFVKRCLEAGKSVATSNKALVAKFGPELMQTAEENGVNFLFEASCGGGIPIIRPLNTSLTGDDVDEITGILNGTTNYILSKMADEGSDFDEVLKDAQAKGYAEADPTADVEGHDARRKIAILSTLAYRKFVDFEDVYTEGITKITADDIRYAKAMGKSIKLLGTSRKTKEGICAMVSPVMLAPSNPLYAVNDVFNAIFVHGNMLGDAMFYGSGAGKLPTASAVAGDVIDAARNLGKRIPTEWSNEKLSLMDIKDVTNRFFVRVDGTKSEKEALIQAQFGEVEFVEIPELAGEFAFVTPVLTEAAYNEKAEKLDGIISMIRVRI